MAKAAQRQFLVTLTPTAGGPSITGYWAQKSGGATSASLTKVFDGGNPTPTVLSGVAETSDIQLTRPYDPTADEAIIAALLPGVGNAAYQVSVTATDVNYVPISGTQRVYNGILSAITPSDVDASSSNSATFSLTFSIASVA